jgi:acetyl-CoA carboxylase alpha subunit
VDTCGAWPSFDAERDGQSEAIATNLTAMAGLSVPVVTLIVGEGGSGGALGIGMGNRIGKHTTTPHEGGLGREPQAIRVEG